MSAQAKYPLIYEINTWVWLHELSIKTGRSITLATVPEEEWEAIAALGFNAVWFMGVWERSPRGIRVSMANEGLVADFRRALPDFTTRDNTGSPYCVRRYVVDHRLGGPEGLAAARHCLAGRGIRLILDFVPNHVAIDNPWILYDPEFFIQGTADDLRQNPDSFVNVGRTVFACGKDPYFPAWADVVQVNAFHPGLRAIASETLIAIAAQCDGVRCDMAMLLMNSIFRKTWGDRAGTVPGQEYWRQVIPAVKEKEPGFLFIAEAYWDMEWELQQQGFDYCYDKQLYDRLTHGSAEDVRLHLCADIAYQSKLLRFIENHDEPRAAAAFPGRKHRAAAVTALTIPGARLVHEGQMTGRHVRIPVFLERRPFEMPDFELLGFYQILLGVLQSNGIMRGTWNLCERSGWPDNHSCENMAAWCWDNETSRCLIIVNLSDTPSQARVHVPWNDISGNTWQLHDVFTDTVYERDGNEMCAPGLYVALPPWGFHFFIIKQN